MSCLGALAPLNTDVSLAAHSALHRRQLRTHARTFSLLPRGTLDLSDRPPLPLVLLSSATSCSRSLWNSMAWIAAFSRTACSNVQPLRKHSVLP